MSEDFINVFTTTSLEDFRRIREDKPENLAYLFSYCVKVMNDNAKNTLNLTNPDNISSVKGAIHVVHRIFPILFEEKDTLFRIMWREHPQFPGQTNALYLMEAISLLLFKPGFTIKEVGSEVDLNYFAIDENLVWKSGVSVQDCPNHYETAYYRNRIDLLRLLTVILSQPLYYTAEDYLTVLNPFSTYFTSKRAKNSKNLFISLVNSVVSYDVSGYGVPYLSSVDPMGEAEVFTTTCLHILLILIEYKPPSAQNLNFLIQGGHVSLTLVKDMLVKHSNDADQQIMEDLTQNEHYRLMRVIRGKINLDPLYAGFS